MTNLINLKYFLKNNAIGFESFFDRFERLPEINSGFPHYNIKKAGLDKYVLEMAVAGYKKSDIDVQVQDGVLSIKGKSTEDEEDFDQGEAQTIEAELTKGIDPLWFGGSYGCPDRKKEQIKEANRVIR